MSNIVFNCPSCGKRMYAPPDKAGARGKCTQCSAPIVVPQPAPVARVITPPPPVPNPSMGQGGDPGLPERMRANRVVAGTTCPGCNAVIELGDPVVNCPRCGASSHERCHDAGGGCPSPACRVAAQQAAPALAAQVSSEAAMASMNFDAYGAKRPCPYCGESILTTAKKCRFCNEFLDESLRAAHEYKAPSEDDNMTPGDIVFCILCSGIACIFGLVYGIQGKKKGWKMMGLAFGMAVLWNIIFGILGAIGEGM